VQLTKPKVGEKAMRLRVVVPMLLALFATACGASPTLTPLPTLTPTAVLTPAPQTVEYSLNNDQSIINYLATGAFNIQIPGTFKLMGQTVKFVPEGDGYRVKIDVIIDGKSVTAVNGLVHDALYSNLELDKYPTGHFVADSLEIVKLGKEPITFTASGNLELHGRMRPVKMPITLILDDSGVHANGETMLDLLDFEVNVPTAIMNSKITFKAVIVASPVKS
jgi:polyisoprenoid-binding protein YceI